VSLREVPGTWDGGVGTASAVVVPASPGRQTHRYSRGMRSLLVLLLYLALPGLDSGWILLREPRPADSGAMGFALSGWRVGFHSFAALEAKPLFNGETLAGWEREGNPAAFALSPDGIRANPRGCPEAWLRTSLPYENFVLRFAFRLDRWAESGIALRAPAAGRPLQSGIGIMLAHDFHRRTGKRVTGAVAGVREPASLLPERYGEWQRAEILLNGDQLAVSIDEVQVQNLRLSDHPQLAAKPASGYLGFVNLCHGANFKDIDLEVLPATSNVNHIAPDPELKEWTPRGNGRFRLEHWGLLADGGDGILYLPGVYRDFEFGVVLRTTNHVNSGVFLRGSASPDEKRGMEVQIYSPPDAVFPTGSIYGHLRADMDADMEGQWIALRIRLDGQHCRVWVNGKQVAASETIPDTGLPAGRIGLQIHSTGQVAFRDLWVRPLGQSTSPAAKESTTDSSTVK
jgi:hypothetical protein